MALAIYDRLRADCNPPDETAKASPCTGAHSRIASSWRRCRSRPPRNVAALPQQLIAR